MISKEKLERYADLLVRRGMAIQPGQIASVASEIGNEELVRMITERAYECGAKYVSTEVFDYEIDRIQLMKAKETDLDFVPKHYGARSNEIAETMGAILRLVGLHDPNLFAAVKPERLARLASARKNARKYFYDMGIDHSYAHWCVAGAANPIWAKQLFPELSSEAAHEKLWEILFKLARVDTPDYIERWDANIEALARRSKFLNDHGIEYLHFTGGGTDLKVYLSEKARFAGGAKMSAREVMFLANIPTEEVFTTPDYRKTEGVARVTRPVLVNNVEVEGLVLTFKKGEIVDFSATRGADVFGAFIKTDVGAKRLGEVALVGIDSPIYQSGIVFREILYDENASCHIAIGHAYKTRLENGPDMSPEELESVGWNDSVVHTDFMISSEEVDVTAKLRDGKTIQLLKAGAWVV